jgi:long-subunit fatty acid transport protein
VAVANDPSAIYWNPAGLASILRQELQFSHVDWPADINYEILIYVLPSRRLGGSFAIQAGVLSTQLEETDEYHPFGTGTTFSYSDVLVGVAYGRRWTDKLLIGAGVKYVREDLGSQVGGPVTSATLVDIGSIYYLGYGSVRIATSLSNFGPEMTPGGSYTSPTTGEKRNYDGFDPAIQFRYGLAFEGFENDRQRFTFSTEIAQPSDNSQRVKAGLEWAWQRRFALRSGYNFNADVMRFSAGLGIVVPMSLKRGSIDYAYTDGGPFGGVSRLTLGFTF